jgi:electron transfer flavoprotein alpha subunit
VELFGRLAELLEERGVKDLAAITEEMKAQLAQAGGFKDRELDEMLAGLAAKEPEYRGEVWVVAEQNGQQVDVATYELLGKARDLADSLGVKTGVLLAGDGVEPFAKGLIEAGADKVYLVEHKLLGQFEPRLYRKAVAEVLGRYEPQIVLFGATPQGRVLAPMVSYRLHCGLTADCTGLHIKDTSRKGEIAALHQTRPALGGNVMATICTKGSKMQMATARPGVMKRLEADRSRKGEVAPCQVELDESERGLDILRTERGGGKVNLSAEVIISGGRGLRTRESYERLVSELVAQMGTVLGAEVERGASRAAVEEGFIDRAHQVGQTGTAVAPKVYVAMGISGAIQHMIGVANSGTIIAINQDPHAPVFEHSDYYLVGDVEEIVPELVRELGNGSSK